MNNIVWWRITKWANGVLALRSVVWESCLPPCCSSALFEPAFHRDMYMCVHACPSQDSIKLQCSIEGSSRSILSALTVNSNGLELNATQKTSPATHVQHSTDTRGLAAFVIACAGLCIFLSGRLLWVICCACEWEFVLKSLRTWQLMEVYSTALKKPTGCSSLIN